MSYDNCELFPVIKDLQWKTSLSEDSRKYCSTQNENESSYICFLFLPFNQNWLEYTNKFYQHIPQTLYIILHNSKEFR